MHLRSCRWGEISRSGGMQWAYSRSIHECIHVCPTKLLSYKAVPVVVSHFVEMDGVLVYMDTCGPIENRAV